MIRQNTIDLQSNFNYFYETIKNAEDFYQPIKMIKTNTEKPWMTIEIKDLGINFYQNIIIQVRKYKKNKTILLCEFNVSI